MFIQTPGFIFLTHLCWKLKWAFLIACCLSPNCPSVNFYKLFTFSSFSHEPLGQFHPNLAQSILWWWGLNFFSNEEPYLFQKGDYNKLIEIHWQNLNIVVSRTIGPYTTKLGTKRMKWIQVFFKWRPCLFFRGDNNEAVKIRGQI